MDAFVDTYHNIFPASKRSLGPGKHFVNMSDMLSSPCSHATLMTFAACTFLTL